MDAPSQLIFTDGQTTVATCNYSVGGGGSNFQGCTPTSVLPGSRLFVTSVSTTAGFVQVSFTENDGNDCTIDACNNGNPSHTNAPSGTYCGATDACHQASSVCRAPVR